MPEVEACPNHPKFPKSREMGLGSRAWGPKYTFPCMRPSLVQVASSGPRSRTPFRPPRRVCQKLLLQKPISIPFSMFRDFFPFSEAILDPSNTLDLA